MHWNILSDTIPTTPAELQEILLKNRSISDPDMFFNPPHPINFELADLGFDVEQVAKAVKIIQEACTSKKKVVIFGDYDADGICATAVLWQSLMSLGCLARPFIPHREKNGYGLTVAAIQEIITADKPDLIITVDNGIVAHAAAEFAVQEGIMLIISDHHQPEKNEVGESYYPKAAAIVHSTKLCGTTVAWILSRELIPIAASVGLDLCGLATISDQVPLQGANRAFAYHGIAALQKTKRVGLLALFAEAGIESNSIDSYSVGYVLSPRINAMGRLAHGLDALRLLCTKNKERAALLAKTLANMNVERQDLTHTQLEEAMTQVKIQVEESIVIAHSENFHEGVIGLIAGKLVEAFGKPALVMSISEKGIKGSARSVKGVNITELLRSVRDDLLEVGGHPMAGGFSLTHQKLEVVKERMFTLARKEISAELLIPTITIDCELSAELLRENTCEVIERFAPFGMGNFKPYFILSNLRIVSKKTLGKEGKHLKFLLEPAGFSAPPIEGLFWNKGSQIAQYSEGQIVKCAGQVETSTWKGHTKVQIVVKDLLSQSVSEGSET